MFYHGGTRRLAQMSTEDHAEMIILDAVSKDGT